MTDLTAYALTHLNAGREGGDRADQKLYSPADIAVATARDHVDADRNPVTEVRVTLVHTGAVFYLPIPAATVPEPAAPPEVETDTLDTLTAAELKSLCGEYGLPKGGTKPQLIARIREHLA